MKILIVDDSKTARLMLRSIIPNDDNFILFEAEDGQQAVEIFKTEHPDLTFLDLTMPVMDGYTALEKIKTLDPAALVIVLSADIQKLAIQRVNSLGAFKFLKKPPVKSKLLIALNEALVEIENRT